MCQLSIIVAISRNNVIGINNSLPWHLPHDLKRFKVLTMGHHIIMGRKTYESLGRLLPGRTTVIVTRNKTYQVKGAIIADSLQDAIRQCGNVQEVFLIGGAELYKEGLRYAQKLYITRIDADFEGDAFFPEVDAGIWRELANEAHVDENGMKFRYITYERIENND